MSESYEVVLQQVAKGDLQVLLEYIEMGSQTLSGLAVSEEFGEVGSAGINKNLIDAIVAHEGDVCLTEHLHEFNVSGVIRLPLVFLRVIKYKGEVDVELSFNDDPSLDIDRVMLVMQGYADELSKKFHIKEFYGGLEPAADIDTRYFTGNTLGPLG
ncbi:hypothetical protein [Pseudomonas sichuanensis]|uniref:hypothetical protein n=1 Tax=Pseudomonas sichuanensis TaxID=2213015 RepID=UPI00215EF52B|nr:hypothetical protein [Pseudomonas sichuanensis]UVL90611.1 hypothetical protein LOY51_06885 [Pseudomonas sichuanensis]